MTIEHLGLRVRQDSVFRGIALGGKEDRIGLYADDLILFIDNADTTLPRAIELIEHFGYFSGLHVNWTKSALMPLWENDWPLTYHKLPLVDHFKYLGIVLTRDTHCCHSLKILLLWSPFFVDKFKTWKTIPLSIMGRLNLIKIDSTT